jgi:hypothetical protein
MRGSASSRSRASRCCASETTDILAHSSSVRQFSLGAVECVQCALPVPQSQRRVARRLVVQPPQCARQRLRVGIHILDNMRLHIGKIACYKCTTKTKSTVAYAQSLQFSNVAFLVGSVDVFAQFEHFHEKLVAKRLVVVGIFQIDAASRQLQQRSREKEQQKQRTRTKYSARLAGDLIV